MKGTMVGIARTLVLWLDVLLVGVIFKLMA